jgi:hypothetical protein
MKISVTLCALSFVGTIVHVNHVKSIVAITMVPEVGIVWTVEEINNIPK